MGGGPGGRGVRQLNLSLLNRSEERELLFCAFCREISPLCPQILFFITLVQLSPPLSAGRTSLTTQLNGPPIVPQQGRSLPSEHVCSPQLHEDMKSSPVALVPKTVPAHSKHGGLCYTSASVPALSTKKLRSDKLSNMPEGTGLRRDRGLAPRAPSCLPLAALLN